MQLVGCRVVFFFVRGAGIVRLAVNTLLLLLLFLFLRSASTQQPSKPTTALAVTLVPGLSVASDIERDEIRSDGPRVRDPVRPVPLPKSGSRNRSTGGDRTGRSWRTSSHPKHARWDPSHSHPRHGDRRAHPTESGRRRSRGDRHRRWKQGRVGHHVGDQRVVSLGGGEVGGWQDWCVRVDVGWHRGWDVLPDDTLRHRGKREEGGWGKHPGW